MLTNTIFWNNSSNIQSGGNLTPFVLPPDTKELKLEKREDLIVVLDANMPVFSEEERTSVVKISTDICKKIENLIKIKKGIRILMVLIPFLNKSGTLFTMIHQILMICLSADLLIVNSMSSITDCLSFNTRSSCLSCSFQKQKGYDSNLPLSILNSQISQF